MYTFNFFFVFFLSSIEDFEKDITYSIYEICETLRIILLILIIFSIITFIVILITFIKIHQIQSRIIDIERMQHTSHNLIISNLKELKLNQDNLKTIQKMQFLNSKKAE